MQQKPSESVTPLYWRQIEDFKDSAGLSWQEVSERIGVTVAMLMMVKAGKRKLSRKAIERFREARRSASPDVTLVLWPLKALQQSLLRLAQAIEESKGRYGKVLFKFFTDELAEAVAKIGDPQEMPDQIEAEVEHKSGLTPKGFPKSVLLVKPDARQCATAIVRFLQDIDERELLFACIEPKWRSTEFFDQLISPSAYALCYAASRLVVGNCSEAELLAEFGKLDTDAVVTAHEDLIHERARLKEFYSDTFYDFLSSILNSELARRLKLDYRPARTKNVVAK